MFIQRIHHAQITISPGEESAARDFYAGVLGLSEIPKPPALQSRGGLWFQIADQQLHIGVEQDVDRLATKAHIAYQVDDLAGWRHHFTRLGIETFENAPIPGHDRFEFRDPFGNRVEFIQPLS